MREVWAELSASMRVLRTNAGMSLRRVEAETGTGRGTLSQIETAKARPNRDIVEWYDTALGGDGLLLSLYAEARGARGPTVRRSAWSVQPGDAMKVVATAPPLGMLVGTGSTVLASWTLLNDGSVPWKGRQLERIGARGGVRLIASDAGVAIPSCEPGEQVEVGMHLRVPAAAATYAAAWQVSDGDGSVVLPFDPALSVVLVARPIA